MRPSCALPNKEKCRLSRIRVLPLLILSVLSILSPCYPATQSGSGGTRKGLQAWTGPDGSTLPFQTDAELKVFLATAEVLEAEPIPRGVTEPWKLLLGKDGIQAHAVFRYVRIYRRSWMDPKHGPVLNFRDDCSFECAAYELSRLLGIDCVPTVVPRKLSGKMVPRELSGKKGTVQIWVEKAQLELDRRTSGTDPPDPAAWMISIQTMHIFDALIDNDDRTQENMLIDKNWKLWLIDHTRSFRIRKNPSNLELIQYCEDRLWERLNGSSDEEIRDRLRTVLKPSEIKSLLIRKERIVRHIQGLIDERGKARVLLTHTGDRRYEP